MGGDHWLFEKLGYWDESYHVPLVVRDPDAAADGTRGSAVGAFTESVDVAATILEWLGLEIPLQVDGWPLTSFLRDGAAPEHWRTEAHFEWDFRNPLNRFAETFLGIPMEHCSLSVLRGERSKYVQFSAEMAKLPPLWFDLAEDPAQLHDLAAAPERTLSGHMLTSSAGLVSYRDPWR
jgi:arylsulfatase A-like enzyme